MVARSTILALVTANTFLASLEGCRDGTA